jgi:hypothetical protein
MLSRLLVFWPLFLWIFSHRCPYLLLFSSVPCKLSAGFFTRCSTKFSLGCPRNNQIFFSVRTETNRNPICFGCFSVCFAKPKNIFSVCFGVSDRYQNNRNKHNFVETPKNLQKSFYIRGSSKQLIFFSRFEPKQTENQSVLVVFRFVFCKTK